MHVAIVSPCAVPDCETGATVRLERFARGLARRGHEVTILCARWWDGTHPTFDRHGVTHRAVTDLPAAGTFAARLPAALARLSPDVVHAQAAPAAVVVGARIACGALRVPLVTDWWSVTTAGHKHWGARLPQLITVPSRTVGTAARECGADADAVRIVPESIDFDLVREAPVEDRADVVYARRLDADANVESFLLALAELRDRDWRAVVVGDGPRRAAAERTAADCRVEDRVAFLGDCGPTDFVPILKGAHVFVQTATRESFPTELCWALACGCVGVIEYQSASSAHELVEATQRGARATSPQELADHIADAGGYDHRTIDDRYADYDHDAVLDRLLDCYHEAIERRGLW